MRGDAVCVCVCVCVCLKGQGVSCACKRLHCELGPYIMHLGQTA